MESPPQRTGHRERGDESGCDSVAQVPAAYPQGSRGHLRLDSAKPRNTSKNKSEGGQKHEGQLPRA